MNPITVIKQNDLGQEIWRYSGKLLERRDNFITIEAFFDREDISLHGLLLGKGDRFKETYFSDRWYNIFEIHSRKDDSIRGWYCNITYPSTIEEQTVTYKDLALDLLVFPDGNQIVLDEVEFESLVIPAKTKIKAKQTLVELQTKFEEKMQK